MPHALCGLRYQATRRIEKARDCPTTSLRPFTWSRGGIVV